MSTASYLPDIVEYAVSAGLQVRSNTLNKEQTEFCCPWCGESLSKGKYKLSLNRLKGVYKCFTCAEHGGILDFIQKIENRPREEILNGLRQKNGVNLAKLQKRRNKKHPAELLSATQLKLIGFLDNRTPQKKVRDKNYIKKINDWIWAEWLQYLDSKKRDALVHLILCIENNQFQQGIEHLENLSKELDHNLVDEVLEAYGSGNQSPTWAEGVNNISRGLKEVYQSSLRQ
ncbi:CHC2 zinc finger domain-containing protein [Paenibacillus xylanilyticus]|uniref:Zinc finger CHC2-type domain-containing protein n=1 Tax=Paenibacillus xylanilyticus TaxID=248903 RepID=A0A7Y6BTN6_9BACL|nr:CHC2 zinc finger domain-containing protein [Paenibacillus xylanilyticus]NUU74586.1 hypothetical protein [Paenibacillus xylanilyticus]